MAAAALPRVVIVPGCGCSPVASTNWYGYLQRELARRRELFSEVVLRDMPDADAAHESIWVPFLLDELRCDARTIVVGHSSGAVAAMRLLERAPLLGVVLLSACHTDLGVESEREAGYYARPWAFAAQRRNAGFILQFHSADDPFIPRREADHVAQQLQPDTYTCFEDRAHFFTVASVRPFLADAICAAAAAAAVAAASAGR